MEEEPKVLEWKVSEPLTGLLLVKEGQFIDLPMKFRSAFFKNLIGERKNMTNYRLERVLSDGSIGVLGTAVEYSEGWRFISNVSGHKSSHKYHATMEKCIPHWVGYPDRCQAVPVKPKHDTALKNNPSAGWDDYC